jgi:hypothetical protein
MQFVQKEDTLAEQIIFYWVIMNILDERNSDLLRLVQN